MRSPGRKKKLNKQSPVEIKSQNIIEPPKNLLPEKSEPEQETAPVVEEEKMKVGEQKEVLPTVEVKTNPPLSSPPPPISVPISQVEPMSSSGQTSNRKFLWIVVAILVVLVVIGGRWLYLSNKSKNEEKKTGKETSMKSTTAKVQPTVTATEEAKLDKYPIKVLNGSGIAGEAFKLQEILEKEGFEVSETGNAENYDYTDTIIQVKEKVEKIFREELRDSITKTYTLGKDELLSTSDSSDVIIIVGSKKAGQ